MNMNTLNIILILIVFILLMLILFICFCFYVYHKVIKLKNEIDKLKKGIVKLKKEITTPTTNIAREPHAALAEECKKLQKNNDIPLYNGATPPARDNDKQRDNKQKCSLEKSETKANAQDTTEFEPATFFSDYGKEQ